MHVPFRALRAMTSHLSLGMLQVISAKTNQATKYEYEEKEFIKLLVR